MGHAARVAGKAGALLVALIALGLASAGHAACVDPLAMPVQYGSAEFTQTRHLSGVRAPLVSRGRATIAAQRVEWRVTDPLDIVTTITPAGITQAVENGPPQRVGPQGGGDAFLSSAGLLDLLSGNVAALSTHYDVAREPAGANGAWRVRLTPKDAALAQYLARLEIGGCSRVEHVEVRQANGDWMEIALGPLGS
ncbi:MAG TPA: outer membrane lipoprotein carrier protein LolA [Caulobacterales bacterium]|nr:outer membrane lipoprotein carrier protein LolA [Caulobacterales bacterium]